MPDLSDVEGALAGVVSAALYPGGVEAGSAVGATCRVYRGYPVAGALEAELRGGVVHVAVQPVDGSMRERTRWASEWVGAAGACPLAAEVEGERARFSGDVVPGLVAGVMVDGRAYAWRVETGPAAVVAAVLGDLVSVDRSAVVDGGTVWFPGGRGVVARVVRDGAGGVELRRQSVLFRVTCWCPTPAVRDAVGACVGVALAGVSFLDVKGWGCRVRLASETVSDEGAAARAWRRDMLYRVEYPTVLEQSLPSMLFGVGSVNTASYLG